MIPRLGLTLGGLLTLLLTPVFSLSYFFSFGHDNDESPPRWLAQLREPLLDAWAWCGEVGQSPQRAFVGPGSSCSSGWVS